MIKRSQWIILLSLLVILSGTYWYLNSRPSEEDLPETPNATQRDFPLLDLAISEIDVIRLQGEQEIVLQSTAAGWEVDGLPVAATDQGQVMTIVNRFAN